MEEISLFAVHMPMAVDKPFLQTLHSGFIGQGNRVDEFEDKLAEFIENKNVLTVNSATSGLELALHLAGVARDSEVISTPMTCMATNTPILSRGAIPVWADVDPTTGLIDPIDVERKITNRTRAIMAVHWGGLPCDLEALARISAAYGIPIIEDAAHAFGATFRGRKLGNDTAFATVFSFQAIKHITTGDGGALFLALKDSYKRGKLLRWYGIDREGERKDMRCEEDVIEAGWKFHMNDLAATLGIVQMEYLPSVLTAHRENARYYLTHIKGPEHSITEEDINRSAHWLYTMNCCCEEERWEFMEFMRRRKVMVSQVHARHDTHTAFQAFNRSPLPGVEEFASRHICIPVHWKLTENERNYIVESVNEFYKDRVEAEYA
jgi:dTDP-4-amino-4,6-dideoxygalactose transaminase